VASVKCVETQGGNCEASVTVPGDYWKYVWPTGTKKEKYVWPTPEAACVEAQEKETQFKRFTMTLIIAFCAGAILAQESQGALCAPRGRTSGERSFLARRGRGFPTGVSQGRSGTSV